MIEELSEPPIHHGRASMTREAILAAAERLYAQHGVAAVSNRQVTAAARQGNNAAVGYYFGSKSELVRSIEDRHRVEIEKHRQRVVAFTDTQTDMRAWVSCWVRPLTDHLADLGNPTSYAGFAAQVMKDPTYREVIVQEALTSPSLVQVINGINRCLPDLPPHVRYERKVMARNLFIYTCAERERTFARSTDAVASASWREVGTRLIDAIVGMWLAPVTSEQTDTSP